MKSDFQVLLIALCALMPCTGYAFVSSPAAQQRAANSTTATSNRDDVHTILPAKTRNHKAVTVSHEPGRRQHLTGKIHADNRASVVDSDRSTLVHNNSQRLKPPSRVDGLQPNSIKPIGATNIAVNRNLPIQPVEGSAIGGRQFNNSHRTAIPGAIGGPAKTTRNPATLSGTGMHSKGLN